MTCNKWAPAKCTHCGAVKAPYAHLMGKAVCSYDCPVKVSAGELRRLEVEERDAQLQSPKA